MPCVTTTNPREDFEMPNYELSKKLGYIGEHMAQGVAQKISGMVSGKRMSVMTPRTFPRVIKRKKINIRQNIRPR
jgi:hypothetical protein